MISNLYKGCKIPHRMLIYPIYKFFQTFESKLQSWCHTALQIFSVHLLNTDTLLHNHSKPIKIRTLTLIQHYHLIYKFHLDFSSCPNNVLFAQSLYMWPVSFFNYRHPKTRPLLLERGREGEWEGEKHWCERKTSIGCLSHASWPAIKPAT